MKTLHDEGTTLVTPTPTPTTTDAPVLEPTPPPEVRNFYPLIGLIIVVTLGLVLWALLLPGTTSEYTGDWKDSITTAPADVPADYTGDWKDSITAAPADVPADYTGDWKDSVTTEPAADTGDWKDAIAE
jgi:hypothetical protein